MAVGFSAILVRPAVAAPLVVIDPGHGGAYSNANANGLREKNVNLAIALELRRQLLLRGYRVAMTRTTDTAVMYSDIPTWNYSSYTGLWAYGRDGRRGIYNGIPKDDLQARVNRANSAGADLFICIHNNGAASRYARGTETFASSRDPLGVSLSRLVHRRIVYRTRLLDRHAKTTDFYVLRWSNMPAILVEGAFITSPSDAYKLKQYWFRRAMAVGIAEAVHSWFRSNPMTQVVPEESAPDAEVAAVNLSRSVYTTGAPVAVIARSDLWADAAGAGALSVRLGGPLLWSGATLSSANATELARLAPQKVLLVGLSSSFSEDFRASVASASSLPTSAVERVSATGRAELAASIAASMTPLVSSNVIFADENDILGILAASGPSARLGIPVLLTRNGVLVPPAASFVASASAVLQRAILMGPVLNTPQSLVPSGCASLRVEGAGVAAEAATLNSIFYRTTTWGSMPVVVADPAYGPGYLSAALRGASAGRVLAPVSPRVIPDQTRAWQTNRRPQIGSFLIFDARGNIPPLMGHMLLKADR
jgi:N-acetylmuramoyl-L-alanine amidase